VSLVKDSGVHEIFSTEDDRFKTVCGRTAVFHNGSQYEFVDVISGEVVGLIFVNNDGGPERDRGSVSVSRSANAVALHDNDRLRVFDLTSGQLRWSREATMATSTHWSDDGSLIALADQVSPPSVLDAQTGNTVAVFDNYEQPGPSEWMMVVVAFSPDGTLLALGTKAGRVHLWDFRSGHVVREFVSPEVMVRSTVGGELRPAAHDLWVMALAFSPDGRTLASGGYNHMIRLWNVETGELEGELGSRANPVVGLRAATDGQTVIAAYQDGSVRRIDVSDGTVLAETTSVARNMLHSVRTREVRFALHAERFLVCSSSMSLIRVHNTGTLQRTGSFCIADCESVDALAMLPDGKRFLAIESVGTDGRSIRLVSRSVDHGKVCKTFEDWPPDLPDRVWTKLIAVSQDGGLAAVAMDGMLSVWSVQSGTLIWHDHLFDRQQRPEQITSLRFAPNGTLAVGMDGFDVVLINAETGMTEKSINARRDCVTSVAFSPAQDLLAIGVAYDDVVRVIDIACNEVVDELRGHQNSASQVEYTPCGTCLVSGGFDGLIKVWNTQSCELIHTIAQPQMVLA
jgi:WD40 repeat protein